MSVQIKILNLPQVEKFLNNIPKDKMDAAAKELVKQAFETANEVKMSIAGYRSEPVSVDTGRFLNSVDTSVEGTKLRVFTDVVYAPFLEYGTSKFQARRHFNNSAIRIQPIIITSLRKAIK